MEDDEFEFITVPAHMPKQSSMATLFDPTFRLAPHGPISLSILLNQPVKYMSIACAVYTTILKDSEIIEWSQFVAEEEMPPGATAVKVAIPGSAHAKEHGLWGSYNIYIDRLNPADAVEVTVAFSTTLEKPKDPTNEDTLEAIEAAV